MNVYGNTYINMYRNMEASMNMHIAAGLKHGRQICHLHCAQGLFWISEAA